MILHTKAEIGDKIYFLKNNKICSGAVDRMTIIVDKDGPGIEYFVGAACINEDGAFLLKTELIDDLINKGDK